MTAQTVRGSARPVVLDAMRLPMNDLAPGAARRRVRETLGLFAADPDAAETAVLLVSELATNAVVHARRPVGGTIALRLIRAGAVLRVEVDDPDSRPPRAVGAPEESDEHGRGLVLVAALADGHGMDLHPDGKTAWAELVAWASGRPGDPDEGVKADG